jgi:hypothetical protein
MTGGRQTARSSRKLVDILNLVFLAALLYGVYQAAEWEIFAGYVAILVAAMVPARLWLWQGARGIPIFAAVAALYVVYFGIAALRGVDLGHLYSPDQILAAELTVAGFLLVSGTIGTLIFPQNSSLFSNIGDAKYSDGAIVRLIFAGYTLGLLYYISLYLGLIEYVGSFSGLVRAVTLTPAYLACFLMGHAKATKSLSGFKGFVATGQLLVLVLLNISSLFLVGAATQMLAVVAGYFITARRLPWITISIALAVLTVLQAGKLEMRTQRTATLSAGDTAPNLVQLPFVIAEWFEKGLQSIAEEKKTEHGVFDRASLMAQLLRVQEWTPARVPYMYGETYAYLPQMLLPRFIQPDRPPTQVVMGILDIRYGFLEPSEIRHTAVGVSIIAEAFANFGDVGVLLAAICFGVLCGLFRRLSENETAASLKMLIAITALVSFLNLEADFPYLLVSLFQSLVAVVIFFFGLRFLMEEMLGWKLRGSSKSLSPSV